MGRKIFFKRFYEKELDKYFAICEKDVFISFMPDALKRKSKASLKLKQGADLLGYQVQEVPRWFQYIKKGPKLRKGH